MNDTDRHPGDVADDERIVEQVKQRYGRIASQGTSCCGPESSCGGETQQARAIGYSGRELEMVPEGANLGLGCGAPIQHLELQPGEVLLDLGSGGGFDALIAAPLVGPEGRVIGVDMTPEMVERARRNAAAVPWVEFRQGRLESLPVDDASVDAVTSNCVINLVPDKSRVFAEVARVLKPGGRLVIADIVLERPLPEAIRNDLLAWTGCVAGALLRDDYFALVRAAGLDQVEILSDFGFGPQALEDLPVELRQAVEQSDEDVRRLAASVRSITWRASRR